MRYTIESRYPAWARWRPVTASPHGESWPFNPTTRVLTFLTRAEAMECLYVLRRSNASDFRVAEETP